MSRIVIGHEWIVRARRLLTGLIRSPTRVLSELHAQPTGRGDVHVTLDVVPNP